MRETRTSGSEGGGREPSYPISMDQRTTDHCAICNGRRRAVVINKGNTLRPAA